MITVEALAEEILRVDPTGMTEALEFSRKLLPFIERHIAAGQQGAVGAVPDVKALANRILSTKTNNTDADDNALALIDVLSQAFGHDTISPAREWMEEAIFEALEATPQPADTMINGLTEAETAATASVMGLAKPAGAVPLPEPRIVSYQTCPQTLRTTELRTFDEADMIRYGDAREAAGRADAVPDEWRDVLLRNFPMPDDAGLDEVEHHCEWSLQQDRKRLHAMLAANLPRQPAAEGLDAGLCSDCPPDGYPTDETRCLPCPRRPLQLAAVNQPMTTQGEGGGLSASTVEAISAAMIRMGVAVPEGKERQRAHAESMVIELCHAITSRTAEGAGREAVVTTLVCDPEDESGDGPWFSLQDWARLRELPPGTKLYTNPSPVADAEALAAMIDYYDPTDHLSGNGCHHGFKPAKNCPNEDCEERNLHRALERRLTGSQP